MYSEWCLLKLNEKKFDEVISEMKWMKSRRQTKKFEAECGMRHQIELANGARKDKRINLINQICLSGNGQADWMMFSKNNKLKEWIKLNLSWFDECSKFAESNWNQLNLIAELMKLIQDIESNSEIQAN